METVQRTIYGAHLQTAKLLNAPHTILPNSTLNQKFNLFPNEVPNLNEYPSLAYIGIGNKGASYDLTSDGYVLTTQLPHLARDASLYNFIPFVIRPISSDLSSTERLKYRLRVPTTINGTDYVAYYLKVLPLDNLVPSVELRNVNNGVITTSNFTPDQSDLSPTPPTLQNQNVNDPNGDYLVSTAKVTFTLDAQDITEILDAANLLYGDPRYAVINEVALCTGVDKILQGTFGNTTSNYTDSIATQVAAFISQYHALSSSTTQVQIELDIGSVESLLI
jgi:hypothetical protein